MTVELTTLKNGLRVITDNMRKRKARATQRHSIVSAEYHRLLREPLGFGALLRRIGHPAIPLAQVKTPCRHSVGRRKGRITFDRFGKQPECLVRKVFASTVKT